MKKSAIAWAAVLALALTSCGNAPSKAPETEQKTTVETLHMLGIEQGDVVYEDFSDEEIGLSDYSERRLLYEIDETTATARPVCAVPLRSPLATLSVSMRTRSITRSTLARVATTGLAAKCRQARA